MTAIGGRVIDDALRHATAALSVHHDGEYTIVPTAALRSLVACVAVLRPGLTFPLAIGGAESAAKPPQSVDWDDV